MLSCPVEGMRSVLDFSEAVTLCPDFAQSAWCSRGQMLVQVQDQPGPTCSQLFLLGHISKSKDWVRTVSGSVWMLIGQFPALSEDTLSGTSPDGPPPASWWWSQVTQVNL